MKNSLKKIGYRLSATLLLLTFFQTIVRADDGKTASSGSMSTAGIIGGFLLIVALVVLPAFKGARKTAAQK